MEPAAAATTTTTTADALLTSVAVVMRTKVVASTEVGALIDAFIGVPSHCTLLQAVSQDDVRLLRRLVAMQRPEPKNRVVSALKHAAAYGRLELLEAMYPYCPPEDRSDTAVESTNVMTWIEGVRGDDDEKDDDEDEDDDDDNNNFARVLAKAVKHSHVDVAKWLFARLPAWCTSLEVAPYFDAPSNATEFAAKNGHVELLDLFHASGIDGWSGAEISYAATENQLEAVKWLLANRTGDCENEFVHDWAVRNGHVDVVDYVCSQGGADLSGYAPDAAQSANLEMIRWFIEHYPEQFRCVALGGAVRNGHLDVVKVLHDYGVDHATSDDMDEAARGGHLGVIQWIYEHRTERCTIQGLVASVKKGDLGVATFLLENDDDLSRDFDTSGSPLSSAVDHAAVNGYFDILKLILNRPRMKCPRTRVDGPDSAGEVGKQRASHVAGCTTDAMDAAATSGFLDIVVYLHENRTEGCTTEAMDGAARNGHLEVVKYLHEHRTEGCTTAAMDKAAANGHLSVVQYLHDHRTEGCTTLAMNEAARFGHLDVVQFLHENRTEGCTTATLFYAATGGYLDIVRYLHEHRSEGCTTQAMDFAARFGHLDVVQYLHENRTEGCTKNAMDLAAANGHLEVVQFLYANRSEGCTTDAMDGAIRENHDRVVEWLRENLPEGYMSVP